MRLACPAESIRVGDVLRTAEDGFALVECFADGETNCRITRVCRLKRALAQALEGFLATLDGYTLAGLLEPARPLARILTPNDIGGRGGRQPAAPVR